MERLRDSVTGKVLSVVLMLCLTFLGSLLGFKALLASEYASAGSWRETQEYRELVREYGDRLASLYAYDQKLLREDLSYVGRRQAESVLEQAAADLDPSATNFRYIVRDSGGAQLSTNLSQGESLPTPLYYGSFVLGQYYISEFGSSDYAESTTYYEYSVEPAA